MRQVFADTSYWLALPNPLDELHQKARAVSAILRGIHLVSSEMVLAEVLNHLADEGPSLREASRALAERLQHTQRITIVPQSSGQFRAALSLYG